MSKKCIVLIMLMAIMIMPLSIASAEELGNGPRISINENDVEFDDAMGYPFIDEHNRIQVPVRATLEAFGASVNWHSDLKVVSIQKNGIKIEVPVNESYIFVEGEIIPNDAPAQIKDGRVYMPIRIVLENLGAELRWDSQLKTVFIKYPVSEEETQEPEQEIPSDEKKDEEDISEPEVEKMYLDVEAEDEETDHGRILITGETNLGNKVLVNGRKIDLDVDGQFEYLVKDLVPNKNTIIIIAENQETDETIKKEIDVFYNDLKEDDEESKEPKEEEDDDSKKSRVKLKEDFYGSTKPKEETVYKKPVIYLDSEIPEVVDVDTFTISGTCENTEYLAINSPRNYNTGMEPVNNRFSFTVKLATESDVSRKEKGVGNVITIIAKNGDKAIVKEHIIYYNGD